MREIETDWWFIALPEQWHSEQDDDSILIFDEDELGCISLSTLQPEQAGAGDENALRGLLQELGYRTEQGREVSVGACWKGWEYETEDDGDYVREWFLHGAGHLLIISYACDLDDRDMDRAAVDEILDSLRPVE